MQKDLLPVRRPSPRIAPESLEARTLLSAAAVAAAGEAAALVDESYSPSRIIVRLRDGADPADAKSLAGTTVGKRVGGSKLRLREVMLGKGVGVAAALKAYRKNPLVAYAEPDWKLTKQAVANDYYVSAGYTWGLYGSQTAPASPYGSRAADAWAAGATGAGGSRVYVGVIDEGVQVDHPDLAANAWTNPYDPADGRDNDGNGYVDDVRGWDFAHGDNSVYDPADGDEHGTHVAGTIAAAGGNGVGVAGVSWGATVIPAKFLGPAGGYTSDVIRALDYFTDLKTRHGLNIVATNNSWGGGGFSQGMLDAVTRAARANILFVAAAGNGGADGVGDNNDAAASYPSNFNTAAAAGYDAVVSVAAIDQNGNLGGFSNYGAATVDLAAPGVSILSTTPNGYGYMSGTSMATPHVTGAVALYAAANPGATAAQIRAAVLDAARAAPTAAAAGRVATGGRLDVAGALQRIAPAAAPSGLTAAAASDTAVVLRWADNAGNEDGFRVERLNAATAAFDPVGTTAANATVFTDATLQPGTGYTYRVRAVRGATVSAASNEASATTTAPPPVVPPPPPVVSPPPVSPPALPPPPALTTLALRSPADAYVLDGSSAGANFGNSGELQVRLSSYPGNWRESYLRFDLTGVAAAGQITSAKVRVYGRLSAAGSVNVGLFPVASNGWSEAGLNWSNKPAAAAAAVQVKALAGTASGWVEYDVTDHLRQQRAAGAASVSLALKATNYTSPHAVFASDEAAANRPELQVVQPADAVVPPPPPVARTLRASADAYVLDGASAGANFGGSGELQARLSSYPGNWRESYLRFDLSQVAAADQITSARLRLYGRLSAAGSVTVGLFPVASSGWTEGGLNWANKPAGGAAALGTRALTGTASGWVEYDVTAYLKQQKAAGAASVNLAVKATNYTSPHAIFASDEAAANRPELVIA